MNFFRQAAVRGALRVASLDMGCHPDFMEATKAASETMTRHGVGRYLAMLADVALTKYASAAGSFEQQLYHSLWRQPHWTPQMDRLVEPVADYLATCKKANAPGTTMGPAKILAPIFGGAAKGSDGALGLYTALMLGSTALGSGLGALNWHMKRQVQEDDAGNEEMAAKADFMKGMADQIRRDVRLRDWRNSFKSAA